MKANLSDSNIVEITDLDSLAAQYQAVNLLKFAKDDMATGVVIDKFELEGNFKAIDINVLADDAPIEAELDKQDATTWIVRLPRPFPLKRINVEEILISQMTLTEEFIEAGFFDYLLPEYHATVGAAAVSRDKVQRVRNMVDASLRSGKEMKIAAKNLEILPVIGDKVMDQSIASVANNEPVNDLIMDAFAIRASNSFGHSIHNLLVDHHRISVYVDSQPQGLKVGLAAVTNDGPVLNEMTELSGFSLASNQETVTLADTEDTWLSGLHKFLDNNFKTPNDDESFQIGIVFSSENPCRLEIDEFSCDYRLLFRDLEIFPDIDPANPDLPQQQKQSFAGTQWQSFNYQLSLPGNSVLHSAVLPFKQTLKRNDFSFVDKPPSEQWLATAKGVELTTSQWTGGSFQLARAQSVRYLLLPLMATTADTVCALEIREDINGHPSGQIITVQSLSLQVVGVRAWMVVALDDSLSLYSKKLWWLVKTTQGNAVQFVDENPRGSGISHFSLTESGGPGSVFRFTSEKNVVPIFAKEKSDGFRLHAFLGDGDSGLPVSSSDLPGSNLQQFDLLPVLSAHNSPESTHIAVRIASLLKGNVVLYPVEISYELTE